MENSSDDEKSLTQNSRKAPMAHTQKHGIKKKITGYFIISKYYFERLSKNHFV